jgi:hypothetical protein
METLTQWYATSSFSFTHFVSQEGSLPSSQKPVHIQMNHTLPAYILILSFHIHPNLPNSLFVPELCIHFPTKQQCYMHRSVLHSGDRRLDNPFSYSSARSANVLNLTKLHGLSPRANYTDRATAACRRSDCQLLRIEGCHAVSVTDPYGRILEFSRQEPLLFYQVAPQLYSRG